MTEAETRELDLVRRVASIIVEVNEDARDYAERLTGFASVADIAANADPPLPPRAWLEMNRAAILHSIDAELAHRDKPWFGLNP